MGDTTVSTAPAERDFRVVDEDATAALAAALARVAELGDVLALEGELGAGKTAFARAFIRALAEPDEEVPSPTFTLVQVYGTDLCPIYHFDLYRLGAPEELIELGIEDALAEGISLIEWPALARSLRSERWLTVAIGPGEGGAETRTLRLTPGRRWRERLDAAGLSVLDGVDG